MTTATIAKPTRKEPKPLHGVKTPELFATINAVAAQPELAKFTWRAKSRWMRGTHTRSTINGYFGAGGEQDRGKDFIADADHTTVLTGDDKGPTPAEWILHGLAACLTAGIANIAAARGIELDEVTATIEGDMDLRGILGISDEVRNGYQGIRVRFDVKGDAPPEKLKQIVEQSCARSAVFDIVTNRTPVTVEVA